MIPKHHQGICASNPYALFLYHETKKTEFLYLFPILSNEFLFVDTEYNKKEKDVLPKLSILLFKSI